MEGLTESPKGEAEKVEYVTLPESLLKALYELQKEPRGYEWGGGIDFEIINDEPQVERIIAYFGEEGKIPSSVLEKYWGDIEVMFHTHPRQKKVQPSAGDFMSFIASPSQVEFIIAEEEIGIFEKTPDFEKKRGIWEYVRIPKHYDPEGTMPGIVRALKAIGIDVSLYAKSKASPVFDLNIIRQIIEKKYLT